MGMGVWGYRFNELSGYYRKLSKLNSVASIWFVDGGFAPEFSCFRVPEAADIDMAKNPLQSQPDTPGGYGLIASPRGCGSNRFDISAILLNQQLRNGVAGREHLGPPMQNLTTLLPGALPAPTIFELVEQVFDGPATVVRQQDTRCRQAQVGAQDQSGLPQGSILIFDL